MSTPAARICGPPMPKISRLARCFRAVARRAAYISPLASPAERRREGRVTLGILPRRGAAVLRPFWELCAGELLWGRPGAVAKTGTGVPCPYWEGGWCFRDARWHAAGTRLVACGNRKRCAGTTARGVGIVWEMQLLLFVLELVEAVVNAALGEEFLVRALFAEAALVEDENTVGMLNRAETMRDDQRGAAAEQAVEGIADLQLGLGIHARSSFVKDEEARIVRQGAGKIDELALSDRERGAAFVDTGADAFGKGLDEIGKPDFADGVLYGGAIDVRRAKANVGFDGAAEQEGILENDAEEATEILQVDLADVDSDEKDLTALKIVEAKQERDKRGLAGTGVSDDG